VVGGGLVLEHPPGGLDPHPVDIAAGWDAELAAELALEVPGAHRHERGEALDGEVDAQGLVGPGEHLVGPGHVQRLHAVEGEDGDRTRVHPGTVRRRPCWHQ